MRHGAGPPLLERQAGLGAVERLDLMGWMAPSRHRCAKLVAVEHHQGGAIHMEITTIGLDLAKHVFQVHGVDEAGHVVVKRRLRRAQVIAYFASLPPCLIGMEACATAHFWARELGALGHEVRLMPPQYVKAYVKRGKNDAVDAAAVCEAVTRPSMRVVPVKTEEQQSALMMHRARELLVRQRTQLINAVRGHLAEFGLVEAQGPWNVPRLLASMQEDRRVPELAREVVQLLAAQLDEVGQRIAEVDTGSRLGTRPVQSAGGSPPSRASGR
jgi:transposase